MNKDKLNFARRKTRVRSKIAKISDRIRLSVFKSNQHIYAQLINDQLAHTIVSVSTLDKELRKPNKSNCNIAVAEQVGLLIAEKAVKAGITKVVFDKGGYKYHGVIKVLADSARQKLEF